MSSNHLNLNKRQRLLEPSGYSNISVESLCGSADQHSTPPSHNRDTITPNLPAFRGPSEAATSGRYGGSDQTQEPGNDWRNTGHASFNSGSQRSFWQDANACISSLPDSGWGASLPNAQFTHYGEPATTSFFGSMALNINVPQESSPGPMQLSQTLGWGGNLTESGLLSGDASDIEVEEETEETLACNVVEELCDPESELICFGMFVGIAATCQPHSVANAATYAVELESPSSFSGKDNSEIMGTVDSEVTYLTAALLADADTELQAICSVTDDALKFANSGKRFRGSNITTKCSSNIILYGQSNHAEDILLFIDQCNGELDYDQRLYLQDPVGCDRNVRYCNPQRLPPLDPNDYQYTLDIGEKRQGLVGMEDLEPPPELLELLDSQEDLPEASQPPAINHLNDLATLLKFLNAYPYNDKRVFDADISHMWKAGNAEEAVKRLKRLAGCLLLRRPRKTVELPPRRDLACHIELQPDERELYNQIRTQTISQIDQVLLQGSQKQGATSSFSVLQQIVGMRLKPTAEDLNQAAQGRFNLLMNEVGSISCQRCAFTMDINYNLQENSGSTDALFSRCAQFFCPNCVQAAARDRTELGCGHDSSCIMASVSTSPASLEAMPISMPIEQIAGSGYIPTKVTALIEDLKETSNDVKCVVFSTWTMTLDIIEVGLKQAGISVLRYDGKVPQRERQNVIDRFRDDSNPTIEDQALARIHRMGQEKEVTTVRFYVKDSFEEFSTKQIPGINESEADKLVIVASRNFAQHKGHWNPRNEDDQIFNLCVGRAGLSRYSLMGEEP
ncbi:hypothetical protein CcaCcLH18_06391 [Colletotrichum camelliae]|nr:hypothetical protein CcaCcLH18_06391 [Colletotrichum camelliae]